MQNYLVRFAAFAHVARFSAETTEPFLRGNRVICRTDRGLEIAEVLAGVGSGDEMDEASKLEVPTLGKIIRRMTAQDELLQQRLEKNRDEAITACTERITEMGLDVALIDAEQTFDGKSIYFYFLGESTPELDAITAQLAEEYESKVQFRKFAEAVNEGCGPACGTEEASGCSTGGCGSCAISGACGK